MQTCFTLIGPSCSYQNNANYRSFLCFPTLVNTKGAWENDPQDSLQFINGHYNHLDELNAIAKQFW